HQEHPGAYLSHQPPTSSTWRAGIPRAALSCSSRTNSGPFADRGTGLTPHCKRRTKSIFSNRTSTGILPVASERVEARRIAIIGSGAIGGVLAAAAADAGHDVTLCVRTPFERLLLENDGESREVP